MKLGFLSSPNFTESFARLMAFKAIPVKALFQLRSISKAIKSKQEEFEALRGEILNRYAERDEQGNIIFINGDRVRIPSDKTALLNKEMAELANIEVDVGTISVGEIGSEIDGLTANDFANLEFIVE